MQKLLDYQIAVQKIEDQKNQPEKMYRGTIGAYGSVLQDFGQGTLAELHGKEAVLNEKQLANLVRGASQFAMTGDSMGAAMKNTVSSLSDESASSSSNTTNLVNKLVDSNREGSVKLLDALNMLTMKMEKQNNLTRQVISTVEQYS